jgi:hypothetical protein
MKPTLLGDSCYRKRSYLYTRSLRGEQTVLSADTATQTQFSCIDLVFLLVAGHAFGCGSNE